LQSVSAGELAAVHAGEPGTSEEEARVLDETSRRDGLVDEDLCHRRLEPVQLRQ